MAKNAIIAIKQNTQQLLVWLYGINGETRLVSDECLNHLWTTLVKEGKRSLLRYLVKNNYIVVSTVGQKRYLSLTAYGRELVESAILCLSPARRQWQGEWLVVAVIGSEARRGQNRRLGQLLATQGAFRLSKETYLCPAPLNGHFREQLLNQYRNHVLVWEVENWCFGDERLTVLEKSTVLDTLNVYSGISRDIERLTELKKSKKYTTDQYIGLVFTIYERFFTTFNQDSGLVWFYFKNEPHGLEILSKLQALVFTRENNDQ